MPTASKVIAGTAALGTACLGYSLVEAQLFTLRRFEVPVLDPGASPLKVLHLSDVHITPGQHRKQQWIQSLADLEPDLVLNTGDTISHAEAIPAIMRAFEPLMRFPGAFVPGNNDYFAPRLKNPLRYVWPDPNIHGKTPMPWDALAAAMSRSGWLDLTHSRKTIEVAGTNVALAGTDDPHLRRARYELIAGAADPAADVRIGMLHSPEPDLLGRFADDGYDLVLAGHTHGGQVRIPFGPALVTNSGIDRHRARWLHPWDERMYFHVCAGLGTNPYTPIRFACRPEASLLTLVPRRDS